MSELWFPGASRVLGESAGAHASGAGPKVVHHTTEGSSASGAVAAYRSHRGWPTFTASWDGQLRVLQHMPVNVAARALVNPPDRWETNRANVVQIEHVGFAREAASWPRARYEAIGGFCRWIEAQTGCPRSSVPGAVWGLASPPRLGSREFHERAGHAGHVHVPGNDHWDPGAGFDIRAVLGSAVSSRPYRALRDGDSGVDVLELQRAVRVRASRCGRRDWMPVADGVYGPETARCAGVVAWVLGIGTSARALAARPLAVTTQERVRWPERRNPVQVHRAVLRRPKHCRPDVVSSVVAVVGAASRAGARWADVIVAEATGAGVPLRVAFAVVEAESGFRNVFGHDRTASIPREWMGAEVTEDRYGVYRAARAARGAQGVGPCQLTWPPLQDEADRRGGCWVPRHNIAVGMSHLGQLIKAYGLREGVRRYNGTGPAAELYADRVLANAKDRWEKVIG